MNVLDLQQYVNDVVQQIVDQGIDPSTVDIVSSCNIEAGRGQTVSNTSSDWDIEFKEEVEFSGNEDNVTTHHNVVLISVSGEEDWYE